MADAAADNSLHHLIHLRINDKLDLLFDVFIKRVLR